MKSRTLNIRDKILLAEMVKEHMHRFRDSVAIVERDKQLLAKLLGKGKDAKQRSEE